MKALGIDIGGTTIKAGIIDETGNLLLRKIVPTNRSLMEQLKEIIRTLMKNGNISCIGIGSAGRIDPQTGHVRFATTNLSNWSDVPLKTVIEDSFHLPTVVINDANAAAFGEWFLHYRDTSSLVLLTIGTGLGGGIVINGRLVEGERGEAGEIGHVILHSDGKQCNCGKKGCAEQYISMRIIHEKVASSKGKSLDRFELIKAFNEKDPEVIKAVEEVCSDLAQVVDWIFNFIDPENVIVGGGIAELGEDFLKILRSKLAPYAKHSLYEPSNIKLAKTGNDAGIIGAALYSMYKNAKI
ncbi:MULTISPECIES: ROK family protein [Kosmotoga]|jgi:glucokinase|uniref:ROK family protein n=1 Tax=Kosmotoga olearia (strain ATCC BAA-1733 / DSM 21960 / TBF 19.5.1) TaxID=521045 RepID=C5CIL4_KOSOT|nr:MULTISPECIES: ROK family protein [Kosmotoga]ACR79876.1 ROK family protein [Kosmotoga olearia TBF 19.5.1]MDI3524256.1 glucokinase [Kosmotoga sp.]MDK2953703.1 glucokinase [Kosmotoga sp.]OAA21136.1 hypothetical protein DU53_06605 [Kosmotoga sp. DU53]